MTGWLTSAQAAAKLDLASRSGFRRWARRERVTPIRRGRTYYYSEVDIERALHHADTRQP
jgi:hypothetical protein